MLIIVDHRAPAEALEKLSGYGDLVKFKTEDITYEAVSCHPDIFICQGPGKLVLAPNIPQEYVDRLGRSAIPIITGEFPVLAEYPWSSRYNAVATGRFLIHNFRNTDFMITREFDELDPVHVDQGYTRCNLLPLKEDHFITSDEGIFKVLGRHTGNVLKVTHDGILLEGFPNGFFGGCCGVHENRVFIIGSLEKYEDGSKVEAFLQGLGYEIIELYDGPLFDGGGILFV